jgi:hypothetical protein
MQDLDYLFFKTKEGDTVISPSNAGQFASTLRVSSDYININSPDMVNGISVNKNGILFQGNMYCSSSGKNIIKSNYTENPKSAKMYTYTETVYFEAAAKEETYKTLAQTTGANLSQLDTGLTPIITDVAPGPLPHVHTISMKHVHRVEPAYLYRIPGYIRMMNGFFDKFKEFLSL